MSQRSMLMDFELDAGTVFHSGWVCDCKGERGGGV